MRLALGLAVAAGALAAAEGALHLTALGAMQPFFLLTEGPGGVPWATTNPQVGDNWFRRDAWETQVRSPRPAWFPVAKSADTYRVFVLGESSAYGTPLDDNATWASQLGAMLQAGAQEREVQVLNLGIRAVTASVYLDVLPELLRHEPDLVVLYTGHNELYGVRRRGFPRSMRLWRAIEDACTGATTPAEEAERVGLRPADRSPGGGSEERAATARFTRDLDRLVEGLRGVPLLVYLPFGNERDLAPLCSLGGDAGVEALIARVGEAPSAVSEASCAPELLGAAPQSAGLAWVAGWCAYARGDGATARAVFGEAIEQDCVPVRIRASGRAALRDLPARHPGAPVVVVDPEVALRSASPGGILGHEVFYDHVHLTILGSWLLAREGALAVAAHPEVFGLPVQADALPTYEAVRALQHITPMDDWLDLARMARYLDQSVARDAPSTPASRAQIGRDMDALWRAFDDPTRAVLEQFGAIHSEPHLALAKARLRAGDAAAALDELYAAVAAHPGCGACRRDLAQALEAAGDAEGAAAQAAMVGLVGGGRAGQGRRPRRGRKKAE
ncbi:MAG: hypothetical protein ABIO70_28295 [Pseudomonadota bacterium]